MTIAPSDIAFGAVNLSVKARFTLGLISADLQGESLISRVASDP